MNCTKAIIAVAGYGTRRLPVTKSIEKCMLPLLNRPTIDYVVEDCVKAGVKDIYFVVSDSAQQLRDYYERDVALEEYLQSKGKDAMISQITPPSGVRFHYIVQDPSDGRYGTTTPVWLARDYISADESVLVVMGDQVLYRQDGGSEMTDLIADVIKSDARCGLVGVPVPVEQIGHYGIIERDDNGHYQRIIEHPVPGQTTSTLNNASIYLFDHAMFQYVEADMARPHDGEYMIIDPINAYCADENSIYVREASGVYLDCGSVENWVQANAWLLKNQSKSIY